MKITVEVEMRPGRESIEVEITQEEINAIAEAKVMNGYAINSCQAIKTTYTSKV